MKSTANSKSSNQWYLLIAVACILGAAAVAVFLTERAPDHDGNQADHAGGGRGSSPVGRGGAPAVPVPSRKKSVRYDASGQTGDAAVIARKVMPHILDATRKFIEENITASQTELNAAEREKNPWLYQRIGLSKDKEEQALAIIRKKQACEEKAMEAASVTNEDEAAFEGLKPYQDELDAELKGLLGNQYDSYKSLGDTYEQITRGNARLAEDAKFTAEQAHRLADLISDVRARSEQNVNTPPGEEEDYDEMMKRVAADEAKIRQGAGRFLTPGQINAVMNTTAGSVPDAP